MCNRVGPGMKYAGLIPNQIVGEGGVFCHATQKIVKSSCVIYYTALTKNFFQAKSSSVIYDTALSP